MGRQDVDVEFVQPDLRIGPGHLGHTLVPVGHGDRDAIGFGGTGQVLLGPRTGEFESELQDAVHADARHHGFLHDDLALRAGEHAPADARVFAFGVLANDVHVDLAGLAPAAIAPHDGSNDAGHQTRGTQVHILVELAAKKQQRAPQRYMVGNLLGPADGAKIDGIMAADQILPVVGHHLAVLLVVVPAGEVEMVELQVDTEPAGSRLHHPHALGHGLLADAVTGDHRDSLRAHVQSPGWYGSVLKNASASCSNRSGASSAM